MSEYADKHSKAHRKERVDHILSSTKGKVDASGYTVPGEMDTERKTGPCQPKPRAFAKGGKVEGHKAHHHAGRKSRSSGGDAKRPDASASGMNFRATRGDEVRHFPTYADARRFHMREGDRSRLWNIEPKPKQPLSREAGGPTAVEQLRPQVPSGGLYGSGFSPTHAGMISNAAGLKKGGEAKRYKRADGGNVDSRNRSKNEGDFRPSTRRDFGDSPAYRGNPATKMTNTSLGNIRGGDSEKLIGINDPRPADPRQASDALMEKMDNEGGYSNGDKYKRGGGAKKRSCGGKAGERRLEMAKHEAAKHKADGGGVEGEAVKQAKANSVYQKARDAEGNANFFSAPFKEQDTQSAASRMNRTSGQTGYDTGYKRGGIANEVTGTRPVGGRKARAEGGRAKGKTNINIIIGGPKEAAPPVPPPPSAMPPGPPPPGPGLPPAALGAMSGPPPAMGGAGAPPGMPPRGLPPGMGPR